MKKPINLIICITLISLSGASRRFDDQFEGRKGTELSVQRKKHTHQNRPSKWQNRSYSHYIQSTRETSSLQGPKQSITSQKIDQTSQLNSKQYYRKSNKQRHEKLLIKLIFIMLGALLIITFILLLNFISKRSRQKHNQSDNISRVQPIRSISGITHSELDLDQQINIQKKRLRHLEKLKQIQRKCHIYIPNYTNQPVKYSSEYLIDGIEPSTPVFGTSITPNNQQIN